MKRLWAVVALLVAVSAFGEAGATNVTIRLEVQNRSLSWDDAHTSLTFMCKATIDNQTSGPLTVTHLFQNHAGLALKITDENGAKMAQLYAAPFHRDSFTVPAGGKETFSPYYGLMSRFSPAQSNTTIKIQLEGYLIGSSYDGSVTSNIVSLRIP